MTEVMVRARRQHEQWPRDLQFLGWLARFRFCDASVLEARFATSARKCRRRLARLETADLSDRRHRANVALHE